MTNNKFVRGLFLSTVALMLTLVACQEENVDSTQADVETFTTAAVVAQQDSAQ